LRSAKQKPPSAQAAAYREGSTALHDAKLKQFDLVPFDPAVADTAATWRSRELREVDATSAGCVTAKRQRCATPLNLAILRFRTAVDLTAAR
jgi:hypothetical protein